MTEGRILTLVSYGFVHANVLHILFNMFALWMFGSDIEGIYGKRLFWKMYLSFIVLSGVAGLLAGAFSMAAGEYVSVRSQREMYEHQIGLDEADVLTPPDVQPTYRGDLDRPLIP